jgi:hypothetical protein
MDPIDTLRDLLQAIRNGDRRQAAAFAGILYEYWRFTGRMPSPEDLQTMQATIARIDRDITESRRAREEAFKLMDERLALEVQAKRTAQEVRFAPWQVAIGGVGTGAALFAAAFAFAKLFV